MYDTHLHGEERWRRNRAQLALYPALVAALKWTVQLCIHANKDAFSNGVTDCTGTIDEGDARSWDIVSTAESVLAKADAIERGEW